MAKSAAVRVGLCAGGALLLMAGSIIPLLSAISWVEAYFTAATNRFYTPIKEAASYHFFWPSTLRLLVPATPYLLLVLLLQLGAAYALSRSELFKTRPFTWGLSVTIGTTAVVTTVLWMSLNR
jgi:hypothetical protein